jgi:hypothetical protein
MLSAQLTASALYLRPAFVPDSDWDAFIGENLTKPLNREFARSLKFVNGRVVRDEVNMARQALKQSR